MDPDLNKKLKKLEQYLKNLESVVVAYSGGVDSAFLSAVAYKTLVGKMMAVTAISPSLTSGEAEEAGIVARAAGFPLEYITSDEFGNENYLSNNRERCYHCKSELFKKLLGYAREKGFKNVVEGSNLDDKKDFRPGRKAVEEVGIHSPLLEAGLTKAEIRLLAREMGLPNWNKPSQACLASRVPYGTRLDASLMERIGKAETFLWGLGFREVRVRHHGDLARIEIGRQEIELFMKAEIIKEVSSYIHGLGYTYVTLDLDGYRTGSMNEVK